MMSIIRLIMIFYYCINKDGDFHDDCCHFCHSLEANEVLEEGKNKACGSGSWPNQKQTQCELIHNNEDDIPNFDKTSNPVITVDILSFLFLLVIMAFSVLFFRKRNDPIVFKSGKWNEMCLVLFDVLPCQEATTSSSYSEERHCVRWQPFCSSTLAWVLPPAIFSCSSLGWVPPLYSRLFISRLARFIEFSWRLSRRRGIRYIV